jgi:uncharacterized protein YbaP (TraB family)
MVVIQFMRRVLAVTMLVAVAATVRAEQAAGGAPPGLDELIVTGERTGPGLWHVHGSKGQAWILGTVSPLPRDVTWRSRQVEQILADANVVLVSKPLDIGIFRVLWLFITQRSLLLVHDGKTVQDVMPPALYARFARLRSRYSNEPDKWSRYRPIIATAFLEREALHQVGLSARLDIGSEVRELARKHDVRIEELKVAGVRDFLDALKTMPPETENTCVAGALATIETGLPRLVARAQAWVSGDVDKIQSLPQPPEVDACIAALSAYSGTADLLAQIRGMWLDALRTHIERGDVALAVINMDLLLQPGGLLEELRTAGFTVDAPGAGPDGASGATTPGG